MCGIAGFSLSPSESVNSRRLAAQLLLGIEKRGYDATGVAWVNSQGAILTHKRPVHASEFVKNVPVHKRARTAILHTRLATKGSYRDNKNNHPVRTGNIVVVHNGSIANDDELFEFMDVKREAEVDTVAIAAALHHGPVVLPGVVDELDALDYLTGSMATAWLNDNDPHVLRLAKGYGSPLYITSTAAGSIIFASDKATVADAIRKLGLGFGEWEHDAKLDEAFTVKHGAITQAKGFDFAGKAADTGYQEWGTRRLYTGGSTGGSGYTWQGRGSSSSPTTAAVPTVGHAKSPHIDATLLEAERKFAGYWSSNGPSNTPKRDAAIKDYYEDLAIYGDQQWAERTTAECGGDVGSGSWVKTWVYDVEVDAQVVTVPDSFPQGDYLLRVFLDSSEVALLKRSYEYIIFTTDDDDTVVEEDNKQEVLALGSGN